MTQKPTYQELEHRVKSLEKESVVRQRVEEALRYRVEYEMLITTLSTDFIKLATDQIDHGINDALQKIGEFAGVDRSYVFLFNDNLTKMDNTHEWCAEGIEPQIQNCQCFSVKDFPWCDERIKRLETIHIPRVADLPPGAAEKAIFESQQIKSLIVVPMVYGKSLYGFIGFDSVRTEKAWPEDIITLLRIVGEIFANALERKRAEEELRAQKTKLDTIVNCVTCGIDIVSYDYRVEFQNKLLTDRFGDIGGNLCYKKYMNRDKPCSDCPMRRSIENNRVERTEFIAADGRNYELVSAPIRNLDGTVSAVEVVTDITDRKRSEEALRQREAALEVRTSELEETNNALRVLLKRMNEDKRELEEKVTLNLKELILPQIKKLKSCRLDAKSIVYLSFLESNLNDIVSPLAYRLSSNHFGFTPTEIQVATLVRDGKTTKDIAELLNSSYRTIESHRRNIRMKIGIKKENINLRSFLLSM